MLKIVRNTTRQYCPQLIHAQRTPNQFFFFSIIFLCIAKLSSAYCRSDQIPQCFVPMSMFDSQLKAKRGDCRKMVPHRSSIQFVHQEYESLALNNHWNRNNTKKKQKSKIEVKTKSRKSLANLNDDVHCCFLIRSPIADCRHIYSVIVQLLLLFKPISNLHE